MRGEEVFEKLKRKNIFNAFLGTEMEKRKIFLGVWDKCFVRFRRDFDRIGFGRGTGDGAGFGYLIEEFARRSSRIRRNTPKGDQVADLLLGFLRNGDDFGTVGLAKRLYNPDFIQVDITGRLILITGMVEVKASAEALRAKLDSQIASQESSLRRLISAIENKKQAGSAHPFFQKRKIAIAEKLLKIIAVPAGEGDKVRAFLPKDWECVEIEFSRQELVFIAQLIWPGFTDGGTCQLAFSEGYIARFEREFLDRLVEFVKGRFKNILSDSAIREIPAREILLAISCLGKIPLLDNDINWTAAYFNRREFYGLFPAYSIEPMKELARNEKDLFSKLVRWYIGSSPGPEKEKKAREHALFFLSNLSALSKVLNASLKKDMESYLRVSKMDDFDLNSLLG